LGLLSSDYYTTKKLLAGMMIDSYSSTVKYLADVTDGNDGSFSDVEILMVGILG
jgi:hypothetical protein